MNVTDPRPLDHPNDPPNARLWNMRWFAYLAAPLLFATIILPILAGPIFRQILQWYDKLRKFWLVGFVIVWILYTVMTYVFIYFDTYVIVMLAFYDSSIVVITTGRAYVAWKAVHSRQGGMRHLILSMFLLLGASASLLIDLLTGYSVILGTFAWIALPSIMLYEYRLDARSTKARTSEDEKSS